MRGRFDDIEGRLDKPDAGQESLRSDVKDLLAGQGALLTDLKRLGTTMRAFHEEVLDRLKAVAESRGPTKADFAEFKEMLGRRLDSLEAAVNQHSRDIQDLKRSSR